MPIEILAFIATTLGAVFALGSLIVQILERRNMNRRSLPPDANIRVEKIEFITNHDLVSKVLMKRESKMRWTSHWVSTLAVLLIQAIFELTRIQEISAVVISLNLGFCLALQIIYYLLYEFSPLRILPRKIPKEDLELVSKYIFDHAEMIVVATRSALHQRIFTILRFMKAVVVGYHTQDSITATFHPRPKALFIDISRKTKSLEDLLGDPEATPARYQVYIAFYPLSDEYIRPRVSLISQFTVLFP